MRKKMNTYDEYEARRMEADQEELADRIGRALSRDGTVESQAGLFLSRVCSPTRPLHAVLKPSLCVIAQGASTQ